MVLYIRSHIKANMKSLVSFGEKEKYNLFYKMKTYLQIDCFVSLSCLSKIFHLELHCYNFPCCVKCELITLETSETTLLIKFCSLVMYSEEYSRVVDGFQRCIKV